MKDRPWWEEYKVDVPEGKAGKWEVSKFTVSEEEANHSNAMASFSFSCRGQLIFPGTYTKLTRGGTIVMSDTPSEIRDHISPISHAKGNVLIAGLGLGMVANACLCKPEVERVTVIELSPDVISLVAGHYVKKFGSKFEVVQADINEWKPPKGVRYGAVWIDIWDEISLDHLAQMSTLKKKFSRCAEWKGCWREETLKAQQRREKRNPYGW